VLNFFVKSFGISGAFGFFGVSEDSFQSVQKELGYFIQQF